LSARAGSALWLLKHEVRMLFFNSGYGSKKGAATRGLSKKAMALWAAITIALHAAAYFLLSKLPGGSVQMPHMVVMALSGVFVTLASLMLAQGLKSSVEVLFERGDMDLLLSSPLSSRGIFIVRLAGIVIGVASVFLFFLTPFAHVGLVLGHYRWLGIYPVVLATATVAASLSMLATLGLVRLFGVRRTRVVAQVLGALSGAMIFLLSQIFANSSGGFRQKIGAWFAPMIAPGAAFGPDSLVWLPGQAILGEPRALLAFSLIAAVVFALTVRFTHRFFVHGVQQAVSLVRAAAPPAGGQRYQFGRSLTHAVIVKEWRLIARDPQLISQVLLQLLYMMPLFFVLMFKGGGQLAGIAAGLTFLAGSLTAALAWVIISAEDAPDLLRASPSSMRTIRRAKFAAVTMPALALVSLPMLWVLARDPRSAVLMCAMVTASVATSALIATWCGRPAARGDFKKRAKGNLLSNTLETLNGFAWAGLTYVMLLLGSVTTRMAQWMPWIAAALFAVALVILLCGWLFRRRDD
jgi:ABC-2 type transport system permease protein